MANCDKKADKGKVEKLTFIFIWKKVIFRTLRLGYVKYKINDDFNTNTVYFSTHMVRMWNPLNPLNPKTTSRNNLEFLHLQN